MTLQQMSTLRRWHVDHRHQHPVEFQLWDAVVMLCVLGCVGLPVSLLLGQTSAALGFAAAAAAPSAYVALRRSLHRRGRLRCDWLCASRD
jgi:hypothetical protein